MTESEKQKYLDYVYKQRPPAEVDFFSSEINEKLRKAKEKYDNTNKFVESVLNSDDFEDRIDRATLEGKIFNPSLYLNTGGIMKVIETGDGTREDIAETIISKSGEKVIMSLRLQDILGYRADGYMLLDELDELTHALQADGVPSPEIDKVTAAMTKNGAIVLQRGVFVLLRPYLEEATGKSLGLYGAKNANAIPVSQKYNSSASTTDELPLGFIEYLKNNEKEYDKVEHEILTDPQFLEFFENLKKHYSFHQNLPVEKMVYEMIIRPQLWNKLSPQTKAWVQTLVEKHRPAFLEKIQQVAKIAHAEQLPKLKKSVSN